MDGLKKTQWISLFVVSLAFLATPGLSQAQFLRNLSTGDYGQDVLQLQKMLNLLPVTQLADSGPGSPSNETRYFGDVTKQAVIRFQELYSNTILAPVGLSKGTGFVGPSTRTKLNQLESSAKNISVSPKVVSSPATSANSNSPSPAVPKIESISPAVISNQETVTITGTGFTDANTIHFGPDQFVASSEDGTTIQFRLDSSIPVYQDNQSGSISLPIWAYLENSSGASNYITVNYTP